MQQKIILATLLAISISGNVRAQQSQITDKFVGVPSDPKTPHYIIARDLPAGEAQPEQRQYIVKFVDPPSGRSSSSRAKIRSTHDRFLSDLSAIEKTSASGRTVSGTKILHEYQKAYNGFALITSRSIKEKIEELEYVASVIEDKEVKAIDLNSSKVINADKVWSQIGSTGKNVTIGIIDTGIDYLHPDLGGGLGSGFKVAGGYDFVNEDNDPMDDHGHGTHVAGIAAANGAGLKGVAPDAILYAYKVLGSSGSGLYSWILSGIERTLDPDGNPNTDDALDVVNMSLGGPLAGGADPLSEAVNNAVANGIVYVVAAGNEASVFNKYGTVLTPGVARDAITVGATNSQDITAEFSSRGPVNTYQIKPDVAAPGVNINSSTPGNQYASFNGTSMASPHVAGAVALLLEAHPDWSPSTIKSALMGTAVNTPIEKIWDKGSGRIDVLKAINSTFVVSPASLSLGLSDFVSPWMKTEKIVVRNLSDQPKVFQLSSTAGAGVNVAFSESTVTVPQSNSVEIDVTFYN